MKHKQRQVFYLATTIGNLDELVDLADEENPTFAKPEKALSFAKEQVGEYGMRMYIYKCIPIKQIDRGRIRVTRL